MGDNQTSAQRPDHLKVLVVDDHRMFLAGMTAILASLANEVTVLEAASGEQALAAVDEHPDIDWIFLDLLLPDLDGFKLMAQLREALVSAPVIILSAVDDIATVDLVLRRGASGFVSKSAHKNEIHRAIARIEVSGRYVSADLREALQQYRARDPVARDSALPKVSKRQMSVLELLAQGHSNRAIAEQLMLSENTVKIHVSALLKALNVKNRTECIHAARQLGMIA